jgi:hypothetical protein
MLILNRLSLFRICGSDSASALYIIFHFISASASVSVVVVAVFVVVIGILKLIVRLAGLFTMFPIVRPLTMKALYIVGL